MSSIWLSHLRLPCLGTPSNLMWVTFRMESGPTPGGRNLGTLLWAAQIEHSCTCASVNDHNFMISTTNVLHSSLQGIRTGCADRDDKIVREANTVISFTNLNLSGAFSATPLTIVRNNTGPSFVPCGTPHDSCLHDPIWVWRAQPHAVLSAAKEITQPGRQLPANPHAH